MKALEPLAIVLGNGAEAALSEFRFHVVGVPRLDDEAEVFDHGRLKFRRLLKDG